MVEFVANIAAISILAAASIAAASAALAARRQERSRVLVPVRIRARNPKR